MPVDAQIAGPAPAPGEKRPPVAVEELRAGLSGQLLGDAAEKLVTLVAGVEKGGGEGGARLGGQPRRGLQAQAVTVAAALVRGLGSGRIEGLRLQAHEGQVLEPGDGLQGVQAAVVLLGRLDIRVDPGAQDVTAPLPQLAQRLQDADGAAGVDEHVHYTGSLPPIGAS